MLTNAFAAFPLFISVQGYAKVHLSHHLYYFSDQDPDYRRKQGKEWSLPIAQQELLKVFLKDAIGLNIKKAIQCKKSAVGIEAFQRPEIAFKGFKILYYALGAAALTLSHTWDLFFLYWMIPLSTILQVIIRFGALCEHQYNLMNPSMEESTPIIIPRWWERILLPNLHFTLHIYHHYFPGISFSNLPKAHALFQREGLVNQENLFYGFASFIQYILETRPADYSFKNKVFNFLRLSRETGSEVPLDKSRSVSAGVV